MTHTKDEALIARLREETTYDLNHQTISLLIEAAQALAAQPAVQEEDLYDLAVKADNWGQP